MNCDTVHGSPWSTSVYQPCVWRVHQPSLRLGGACRPLQPGRVGGERSLGFRAHWISRAATAADPHHCPGHGSPRRVRGTQESHGHSQVFFPSCSHILLMLQKSGDIHECLLGPPPPSDSGIAAALGAPGLKLPQAAPPHQERVATGMTAVGT